MKYCTHCGNQMEDTDIVCTRCGYTKTVGYPKGLCTAVKVLMLLSCIFGPLSSAVSSLISAAIQNIEPNPIALILSVLISLAIYVPITVVVWKRLSNMQHISVGLKVVTLIFVSPIAGIILLCMSEKVDLEYTTTSAPKTDAVFDSWKAPTEAKDTPHLSEGKDYTNTQDIEHISLHEENKK